MNDENETVETPQDVQWGHGRRPDNAGVRRWPAKVYDYGLEIAGAQTIPYGEQPRIENIGSPKRPRLMFYIPAGMPGHDAVLPFGTSGKAGAVEVTNGLVTKLDQTIKDIRTVAGDGEQCNVTVTLDDNGALLVKVSMAEEMASLHTTLEESFGKRLAALEAFDSVGKIRELQAENRDKWIKETARNTDLMTMLVTLQNTVYNLQTLLVTMHPETAAKVSMVSPVTLVALSDSMKAKDAE